MIIDKNTAAFRVFSEDPIQIALEKITQNKSGYLISVSANGIVEGVITDGDIRRWLQGAEQIDLSLPSLSIANKMFKSLPFSMARSEISKHIDNRVKCIPLIDDDGHLIALAKAGSPNLRIGSRTISSEDPVFIIAEIGNNHNGSVDLAKRLVDLAVESGADCAKFQMRDMTALYSSKVSADDSSQDLGAQYTLDLLSKYNLEKGALFEIFDYCREKGLEPLCTPWDLTSLSALEEYGMQGYKLASADLTNHQLLREMARTGKTLICSTGMASEAEIKSAISLLRNEGAAFALLHVNSTYPTPYKDVNLNYIPRLSELCDSIVGYSGHERGWFIPVAAVAVGAKIIEKHFTVDRSMEGNDHKVSLLPEEFRAMVQAIRATELAQGKSDERVLTQGELMNREILAKSLYTTRDIAAGEKISHDDIAIRSPGQGLQPNRLNELVGITALRNIPADTPFFQSDIESASIKPRNFGFERPWGVPVRWHDHRKMLAATNMTLLEYHLSYKDMEEPLEKWFDEPLEVQLAVHAPELFAGDHVLDLASSDESYRARSITELQRVCEITRQLKKWHPRSSKPVIITNMGGFDTHGFLPKERRREMYMRIEDSLSKVDTSGVEIIPQTMPPFPWHFGGQSYHNLFLDPTEIVDFCDRNSMRVCFDLSHSQLACNYYSWSMSEFCELVGPYTAHLHVVDAKGVDGEGLQIGEGDMDFRMIASILERVAPSASFVPEIWQGHKNDGAGFWFALDQLEPYFGKSS